jgi:hypothetical protein
MANLSRASKQLFSRPDDERLNSLDALHNHCREVRDSSKERWQLPGSIIPEGVVDSLSLRLVGDGYFRLNDWSFSQLCGLAGIQKETVNRLQPQTAATVFKETLPSGTKPLQILTHGAEVRSIHGASYTRLFDADLLDVVRNAADGFAPPPPGFNGATGLYAGQQDMFAFLIDDSAWVDIGGEQFAPGFFVWNSEVGRRTVGVETFWYQRICSNHIVWDAIEVVSFSRKHTAKVGDAIVEIQRIIERLVMKRDERRDGFAMSIRRAMDTTLGSDAEETAKALAGRSIPSKMVKEAVESVARDSGRFTVFNLVDALTRATRDTRHAGDRIEQDARIGALLSLAV